MTEETKAIKETAIAAQEIAKTSGKAIDAGSKFGGFVAKYISGPLEQATGIVEDKFKYIRWERQQRLMLRAEDFMKEIGLASPTRPVPLKLAIPLLQGASMEEDDDLQDIWAKLLVNAANKDSGIDLNRIYIDILERLTPLEAQILSEIYKLPYEETRNTGVLTSELPDNATTAPKELNSNDFPEPKEDVKLALARLSSYDCLYLGKTNDNFNDVFNWVYPSLVGKCFIQACTSQK